MPEITIDKLMNLSGVKFGTSGARGLVVDMNDRVCFAYTLGFIQHLESIGDLSQKGSSIAVAGDLRASTDRIMTAVIKAIEYKGYKAVNCGKIPSPAVAYFGILNHIPAVMVTGSHIPDDRNGIKYNKIAGEVLKSDEQSMRSQVVVIDDTLFDSQGMLLPAHTPIQLSVNDGAEALYNQHYVEFFPHDFLHGQKIGFYQHSAVGRQLLPQILQQLGAEVICFGHSDTFMPVDTEAIRPEDVKIAAEWAQQHTCDTIFSTDGDSDRPLISDEKGKWLRGDIAGILASIFLGADSVSTPVSCNTALEKSGNFKEIRRTRIGSPYVIQSLNQAVENGATAVVGYEANGGFLTNTDIQIGDKIFKALPTRDTLIVLLSILGLAKENSQTISQLVSSLPSRFTSSGRLKEFPTQRSQELLAKFNPGNSQDDTSSLEQAFGDQFGKIKSIDYTDGIRIVFESEEIVHLRPSGNAPEFRCYNEADSEARSIEMNKICLNIMKTWK